LPEYNFSKPRDIAAYLLTLPSKRAQRLGWTNFLESRGADFMKKVEKELEKLRSKKKPTAKARKTDPETSHQAAESITHKLSQLEDAVLAGVKALGEATQMEVAIWLELSRPTLVGDKEAIQTVSPRFAPLERNNLIEKTGEKRKNRNVYKVINYAEV
jgi:hypothetical protein